MAQPLIVYSVVALLLVAGSGPALQAVRDDSLREFEALDNWRTLEEFPFLKSVRPYLPPLVVDWIIIQRPDLSGVPADVEYRFDDDGRIVLIFPDGCEETKESYDADSRCAPDHPPTDCTDDPTAAGCDPCRDGGPDPPGCQPPECPAGQILHPEWPDGDTECVPDPQCTDDENGTRPAHCPPAPPPEPICAEDEATAYDGTCVPYDAAILQRVVIRSGSPQSRTLALELKVPYENLSIELDWEGVTNPGWTVKLFHSESGANICWQSPGGGSPGGECHPQRAAGQSVVASGSARYIDAEPPGIAAQNVTLLVEFTPPPGTGQGALDVRLHGAAQRTQADDD